jgi:rhodanese-related sulfurtransferase
VSDSTSALPDPAVTLEIHAEEIAKWLHLPREQRPRLIDCREEDELAICQITGNEWVPLGSFPVSLEMLQRNSGQGIVIYCHHGMRSLRAAEFLRAHGVKLAFSMRGGIDAWSRVIDQTMSRY